MSATGLLRILTDSFIKAITGHRFEPLTFKDSKQEYVHKWTTPANSLVMLIPVTAIIKSVRFSVILRIRGIALRNGTLDRNTAKDSGRVVRMFRETHAISAMTSSTTKLCELCWRWYFES